MPRVISVTPNPSPTGTAAPAQSPMSTLSPQGHHLPTPRTRPWGFTACHLQRARPHVLIRKPCHGEPKMAPAPHDPLLPAAGPGERLTRSTRRFSRGPSLPFHRRGKLKAAGAAAACPDPQQDPDVCYRAGGAAPAACPAAGWCGAWPRRLTPSLPSLPPSKKTFHKSPRDGGNSERPCASGVCPNHNTQVPGLGRCGSRPGPHPK